MSVLARLTWTPKPFGPGDIDGEGTSRLLGHPELDQFALLVRETAQNSWDARLEGEVPLFEMHLRTLSQAASAVLRDNTLTGEVRELGLHESLAGNVRVLEIADRGTKGLGGPTRNDVEVPANEPTNFIDFVLSIGVPNDTSAGGGGTYGFGKTAAYGASLCGTVLIWTRTMTKQGLEHRLIGSAIGPNFNFKGRRYTGRHWWSMPDDSGDFPGKTLPIVGEEARRLGQEIFHRGFDGQQTGTSLLIVDPVGGDNPQHLIAEWRKALVRNLWPKMIEGQPSERAMDIRLLLDGDPVSLHFPEHRAVLDAKERCLKEVRAVQAGEPLNHPLVQVRELWCHRPKQLLGHLALTRIIPRDPANEKLVNTVTYMRNRAELVVRAVPFPRSSDNISDWVGVFKPLQELDVTFALSEPPAHDMWTHDSFPSRSHDKTFVKLTMERMREAATAFASPPQQIAALGREASTAAIATKLASLTGSAGGGEVTYPSAGTKGPRLHRSARPGRVNYVDLQHLPPTPDQVSRGVQSIRVALEAPPGTPKVSPRRLQISTEDGPAGEAFDPEVTVVGWLHASQTSGDQPGWAIAHGEDQLLVDIEFPAGLAIEFDFRSEVAE